MEYDLATEQKTLSEPRPKCGFIFPVAAETPNKHLGVQECDALRAHCVPDA
jgi:hypothetical protein